jgi:taurine dioxygenase
MTTVDHLSETLGQLEVPDGIELNHLFPTIGTEITGVDLSQPLSEGTVTFIRRLWLARKVIFFRDQDLTEDEHIRLGRSFGDLDQIPTTKTNAKEGYEGIGVFRRGERGAGRENFWHVDTPFRLPPIDGTIAILRVCPPEGGDTLWVDMHAAYEGLSDWLKRAIEGLKAVHQFDVALPFYHPNMEPGLMERLTAKYPPAEIPVVVTHPETGLKVLYVSLAYTSSIVGLSRTESFTLLRLLTDQASIPEYQCRFRWQQGSVAFWDNRAVQHYACYDYEGFPRELQRVTVIGTHQWPELEAESVAELATR